LVGCSTHGGSQKYVQIQFSGRSDSKEETLFCLGPRREDNIKIDDVKLWTRLYESDDELPVLLKACNTRISNSRATIAYKNGGLCHAVS
jgi:hypothetical protein